MTQVDRVVPVLLLFKQLNVEVEVEHGLRSAPTQYRLYGRPFLQVKRPNQQYQSTEGNIQNTNQRT